MGRLDLALLGTPEARHAGGDLSLPIRKALARLVYSAVEGGLHSREKLAALPWSESDEERDLPGELRQIRGALGER